MCAGACDSVATVFVPVDENVAQVVVQAELEQGVTGACECPAIRRMVIHDESASFCTVPETAVVVGSSSGTVLDAQDIIVVVYHFVKQGGGDLFDRTCQSTGTDVDLVESSPFGNPGVIPKGEVSVGLRGGLDGDCWS